MTLDEFTTVIQYLRSPDSEIVELGRVLGKQMGLLICAESQYLTYIKTTTGWATISYVAQFKTIEQLYAICIW